MLLLIPFMKNRVTIGLLVSLPYSVGKPSGFPFRVLVPVSVPETRGYMMNKWLTHGTAMIYFFKIISKIINLRSHEYKNDVGNVLIIFYNNGKNF